MKRSFPLILSLIFITTIATAKSAPVFTNECGNHQQAVILANLIKQDSEQQRAELRCNKLLTALAQDKARIMAEHGMVMHNLDGSPNSHLRNGGYQLPDYYGSMMSNQVEAIAGGYTSADSAWRAFKQSTAHRQHLLGELPFYLEQDEIGVAFLRDTNAPHVEYWVVYVSKGYMPNQSNQFSAEQIPNKSIFDPVLKPDQQQRK
ncbi:CAP domain-containing protein [Thalassotalea litorea]|uniref:CAP domain-containing protein n=1 Tax=Thalassotalea litorea TaxID=2020715 RepID=A0A5R9IQ99_9GAMM|nr:CAP domain-containing protein [Thalassotalea litorea]TLU66653.1 CAP domain-containing protein [Thalassotalea litorea]